MSVTNFIDSFDRREEKGLEVRKIAEEQVIDRNEADKLIKEYEESVFCTGETLELYDYVTAVEMLGEAMSLLKKLYNYGK